MADDENPDDNVPDESDEFEEDEEFDDEPDMNPEEASAFQRGVMFTSTVLHIIGVDIPSRRLVTFLNEMIEGTATILPSPGEVGAGGLSGNMPPEEAEEFRKLLREERSGVDELHREYARLMLGVIRNISKRP